MVVLAILVLTSLVHADQTQYALQVGALGDWTSTGNMGVGAEILTHVYDVHKPDIVHAFWVGDILANGAFIQFGYELLSPGYYCLKGETIGDHVNCQGSSERIGSGDARWFWQYWLNASVVDFYCGIGPLNSVGPNGTWHQYQIWPNVANGWNFILDGQSVFSFNNVQWTTSRDPAFMVAEETTSMPLASGNLGPVEFRNLSYLKQNGWQQVQSLTAIAGCGALSPNCSTIPYGVASLGANDVLVGADVHQVLNNQLLWTAQVPLTLNVLSGYTMLYAAIAVTIAVTGLAFLLNLCKKSGSRQRTRDARIIQPRARYCVYCWSRLAPDQYLQNLCPSCRSRLNNYSKIRE